MNLAKYISLILILISFFLIIIAIKDVMIEILKIKSKNYDNKRKTSIK